ncbi:MAG TPA: hypothetical protein VJ508_10610, partial [Saprospiraceae bacterium]|nr:hypothetical protein [Saprospiraceae bacterium]
MAEIFKMSSHFRLKIKPVISALLLAFGALTLSQVLVAQADPQAYQVTVLSPGNRSANVIGEGDDYFTQVMGQPHTMDHPDDLMWPEFGVSNISQSNGLWSGTADPWSANPSYSIARIWPVYPGFTARQAAQPGKNGWNYPIQTSKYRQLSFRLKAPPSTAQFHLSFSVISNTQEDGQQQYYPYATGWQVYKVDMNAKGDWLTHPKVYGLDFGFSLPGTFQFDWVRLTDPSTSPVFTVTYIVTGTQAGDAVDLNCYTSKTLSNDSFCGIIAANQPASAGVAHAYYWRTAYLAPGSYYVQAVVKHNAVPQASNVSQGALTIQAAPIIKFDAPSMTSGPDYATVELGNPWDMKDSGDILQTQPWLIHDLQPTCPCFNNGDLGATTVDNTGKTGSSDPFVFLNVDRTRPIDTSKYKYLTFRYKIDGPQWSNSSDRLSADSNPCGCYFPAGWDVRLIFFNSYSPSLSNMNQTDDIIVFDNWNTYQLDLSKGLQLGYWETDPGQDTGSAHWTGLKYWLRFEFLEGYKPWAV